MPVRGRVPGQSACRGQAWPRTVPGRAMSKQSPQPVRGHAKAAGYPAPWIHVQWADASRPRSVLVQGNTRNRDHPPKSAFDPASVREAVAEFTPRRPWLGTNPGTDAEVIVELSRTAELSSHSGADVVRGNRKFDFGSPVVASRSSSPCSPLRSILTRRPAPAPVT
jgi:hypothetical protein